VIPAAIQGVLCGGDPSAGTSKGCLPQCQWRLFLTASISLPIQSPNRFYLNNPHRIHRLAVIYRPPVEKHIYMDKQVKNEEQFHSSKCFSNVNAAIFNNPGVIEWHK
jgi:hypothetical protein